MISICVAMFFNRNSQKTLLGGFDASWYLLTKSAVVFFNSTAIFSTD
jgi:hypothetical protein